MDGKFVDLKHNKIFITSRKCTRGILEHVVVLTKCTERLQQYLQVSVQAFEIQLL
jgi:hypothetical protein